MGEAARAAEDSQQIPEFATEEEAREFWATHDSAPYFALMEDVSGTPPAELQRGPGRERSTARKRPAAGSMDLVSFRIPAELIAAVKRIAAERGLPYQTLMRSWISERLRQETAASQREDLREIRARLDEIQTTQRRQTALLQALLHQSPGADETIINEAPPEEMSGADAASRPAPPLGGGDRSHTRP